MRFPYTEVGPGIFRPLIPAWVWGPAGPLLTDGLLDSGADHTLLTPGFARRLGIDVAALPAQMTVKAATGDRVTCKQTTVIMGLIRGRSRIYWRADVAVAIDPLPIPHWGFRGFLEFFRTNLNGPKRFVTLTAGENLPVAMPPAGPPSDVGG
jgi:hypothetical protein